jgi:hypothetical protein
MGRGGGMHSMAKRPGKMFVSVGTRPDRRGTFFCLPTELLHESLAAVASRICAVCRVANARNTSSIAALCALHPIPNPGAPARSDSCRSSRKNPKKKAPSAAVLRTSLRCSPIRASRKNSPWRCQGQGSNSCEPKSPGSAALLSATAREKEQTSYPAP